MNLFNRLLIKIKKEYVWHVRGGVEYARSIGVKVGENCRVFTRELGGREPYLIEIGNNVTVAQGVVLLTHDGSTWLLKDEKGRRYLYKRVMIGNNVFIGINSIIMPGVIIQDNVIVGAGSIVTKSIPKGSIVAGNPAKIIGNFDNYQEIAFLRFPSEDDFKGTGTIRTKIERLAENFASKAFMKNH